MNALEHVLKEYREMQHLMGPPYVSEVVIFLEELVGARADIKASVGARADLDIARILLQEIADSGCRGDGWVDGDLRTGNPPCIERDPDMEAGHNWCWPCRARAALDHMTFSTAPRL